jgi:hypothetical protein
MFSRILYTLAITVCVAAVPLTAGAQTTRQTFWSFETDRIGVAPRGFQFAVTAKREPGKWVVLKEGSNQVLAQVDRDKTPRRFAMALVKDSSYQDVKISVRAKPIAGDEEMVAGLVWRYRDPDHYYVARWNNDSVRVDRVVKGERELLPKHEIKISVPAKTWQTFTVEHRGADIKVFIGKQKVFEGKDSTYRDPGKIGVWIKADSLTYFDDLTAEHLK